MAGATIGLQTLWTALLSFPLMVSVQCICARVGMVSGQELAGVLRDNYPRRLLYGAVLLGPRQIIADSEPPHHR